MTEAANVTPVFRVPARLYAMEAARPRIIQAALVALLPVVALAVASIYDVRLLIAAMMLLLVAYPGIEAIGWLAALSTPHIAMRSRPQRWVFGSGAITVEYFHSADDTETPDDTETLPAALADSVEYRGKYVYLFYKDSTKSAVRRSYIIMASLIPRGASLPL